MSSSRSRFVAAVMVVATLGVSGAACAPTVPTPATSRFVNPCDTGPGITCDSNAGHIAGLPIGTPRNQLLVFLNGSGQAPSGYKGLIQQATESGFHVVAVRFSSGVGTATACPDSFALLVPDCHRAFRSELTFGANVADPNGGSFDSPAVAVSPSDSVANRLLQLVAYLSATYPDEGWGQYLDQTGDVCNHVDPAYSACDLTWGNVTLVGHSLGSGVALYLSKFHPVARLAMISGPFDQYRQGPTITVAPWISEGGFATSASNMFGLTHATEPNFAGNVASWATLGLGGPLTSVGGTPPYGGAQQLTTAVVPSCTLDSNGKHNSTALDTCSPGTPSVLAAAWRYLFGA